MRVILQLVRKELTLLGRAKAVMFGVFLFALVLAVMGSLALRIIGMGIEEQMQIASGMIWLLFFFTAVLIFNHSVATERETGALWGVLFAKVDPAILFLSKVITSLIVLLVAHAIGVCSFSLLFEGGLYRHLLQLEGIALLAGIGFVPLGVFLGTLAAALPSKELMMPLLLYPLSVPILLGAVGLTRDLLVAGTISFLSPAAVCLVVAGVIFGTLGCVLFEYVLCE